MKGPFYPLSFIIPPASNRYVIALNKFALKSVSIRL